MNGAPVREVFAVSFNGNLAAMKGTITLPDGGQMVFDVKGKRS